ncbi:hypothetical protein Hypma_016157 [Hypsizygus marmoreus]|uniref:DUF7888 domain-containing protein n=1 Tax=Hypsizygus marmoreus TaxID=39966 RepID=A0A369J2T6_HYPMA|nr:hypothetical protein Hypma_016157 [Hypsizygus marmoreus]
MKFSLTKSLLVAYGIAATATLAMPVYTTDSTLSLRAPSSFETFDTRESAFDLQERQAGAVVEAGAEVIKLITGVVAGIKAGIAADKNKRSQFTQDLVKDLSSKNPAFNYVICHTKHTTAFDGAKGTDWGHSHQEFDIKIGGTVGYEIYWAKSGKFTRQGDGGYLNWAYIGNVKSKSPDGKEIVFGPR